MKITILAIGKKHDSKFRPAMEDYSKRLSHYTSCQWKLVEAKTSSSMNLEQIKVKESEVLVANIAEKDKVVLLDETGVLLSSTQSAEAIQRYLNKGTAHLVFVIGGSYGVTNSVKERADFIWSLSPLVFPHQVVRLLLIEQLYRAHSILAGEKYHHS